MSQKSRSNRFISSPLSRIKAKSCLILSVSNRSPDGTPSGFTERASERVVPRCAVRSAGPGTDCSKESCACEDGTIAAGASCGAWASLSAPGAWLPAVSRVSDWAAWSLSDCRSAVNGFPGNFSSIFSIVTCSLKGCSARIFALISSS